jgi:hypothetical protein
MAPVCSGIPAPDGRSVDSPTSSLLALRLARGVGVLGTGTGTPTVIPGTALNSAAWLKFGWLGGTHRLIVIAAPKDNPGAVQFGYWTPGNTRLTVAPATPGEVEELPETLP